MLSERPWWPPAVMALVLGVLFVLVAGGVVGHGLEPYVLEWTGLDRGFYQFLLNLLSFHLTSLILVTVFLRVHGVRWGEFLGVGTSGLGGALLLGLLVGVVALPVALGLNKVSYHVIEWMQGTPEEQMPVKILQVSVTVGKRVAFAVSAVILAPLVEETLFRGVLYPMIKQAGHPRLAVWLSSLVFAAIHANLMTFVPLTVFALLLVWLYEITDTLLAPILAHAVFNLANFFLLIFEVEVSDWFDQVWRGLGF